MNKERWEEAQKHEKKWWNKEFLPTQIHEIQTKYSKMLNEIESEIHIDNNWRILDVGCGPTCISRIFKEGKKTGIDPLLNEYKNVYSLPKDIILMKGVGEDLPFPSNSFELIISRNALDHMSDPEKAVDEMVRVVKKDGYIILGIFVNSPFVTKVRKITESKIPFLKEAPHPHFFTITQFEELFKKNKLLIMNGNFVENTPLEAHKENFNKRLLRYIIDLNFKGLLERLAFRLVYKPFWSGIRLISKHIIRDWYSGEYVIFAKKMED